MRIILYIFFITSYLSCSAQNKVTVDFRLYKTNPLTETSLRLKNAKTDIELFNSKTSQFNDSIFLNESNFDTILIFKQTFNVPLPKDDYELHLFCTNEKIGSRPLDYPFKLEGNESEVEIRVDLNIFEEFRKGMINHHGAVHVFKYLKSAHGINVHYDPNANNPFFEIKSNSKDTLNFGLQSLHSPSALKRTINKHTFVYSGGSDYTIRKTPLFPDSLIKIPLKNMYWRADWPKDRYRYTLLYYTHEKQMAGVTKLSEDPDFVWYGETKTYFRFTYTFDMK